MFLATTPKMLSLVSTLAATVLLAPVNAQLPSNATTDFSHGQQSCSVGGKADCVAGVVTVQGTFVRAIRYQILGFSPRSLAFCPCYISGKGVVVHHTTPHQALLTPKPCTVTATNTKILISAPKTNPAVTELYVEFTQVNSKLAAAAIGGPSTVTGTYGIYSKLCFPADPISAKKVNTLQVLTHGGTLDHTYWDIAPGYSYVDQAAAAGYATFSYDRLGTGLSDHPDPVQIVQLPIQIEIAHILIQKLRVGEIGDHSFQKVVGVGHSLGSAITQAVAAKYPKDLDALILQGTSTFFTYAFTGVASEDAQIAKTDPSGRFKDLADGYHTPAPSPQAIQFAFYRYPGFDPKSKPCRTFLPDFVYRC